MTLPIVNSYNSWSPLEEVWLGDVYPAHWYDNLPSEVRDIFYQLTEITQEDLTTIEQMIGSFGITVRRPVYKNIEQYIDINTDQLVKPQICPRDHFVTLGNTLVVHQGQTPAWRATIDEYVQAGAQVVGSHTAHLNGAHVVRLGNRLIIDTPQPELMIDECLKDYQVELISNGGHIDGCFAILRPGLILASEYYADYDQTFPDWEKIFLNSPEFANQPAPAAPGINGKWWIPSVNCNRMFNEHVIKHAQDWVGDYTETYFELNCLVIDEENVMMLGENLELEKKLKNRGITVHWAPFRTRSFWDGGLHCLTLDIRRQCSKDTK